MNEKPGENIEDDFKKNLDLISKYDNGFLYPDWLNAAKYFKQLAERQTDIKQAIPHLLTIYTDSNHVTIMEFAANAIIKHAINTNNPLLIKKVLDEKQYPEYFLRPLLKYLPKNIDLDSILLDILKYFPVNEYILTDLLLKYLLTDKTKTATRLAKIISIFTTYKTLTIYLPRFLREASSKSINISAHIEIFIDLLKTGKIKSTFASELILIVNNGVDISCIIDDLQNLLQAEEINYYLAYCIGLHFVKKQDFTAFDNLKKHNNLNIKKAIQQVLIVCHRNNEKVETEIINRLFTEFSESEPVLKESIANYLKSLKREKKLIIPNKNQLEYLIEILNKNSDNLYIINYLIDCFEMNSTLREETEQLLLQKKYKNLAGFENILKKIKTHDYEKVCSICENIPRRKLYYFESDLPKEVYLLFPKTNLEIPQGYTILKCKECGNKYEFSYSEEYEDMIVSTEIMLNRIFPEELTEKELIRYRKNLSHLTTYLNEDSVFCLTDFYYRKKNWKSLSDLFSELNLKQKTFMLQILFEKNPKQNINKEFIDTLKFFISNHQEIKDNSVKQFSALHIGIFYTIYRNYNELEVLLKINDSEINTGIIRALYYCQKNDLSDVSFFYNTLVNIASSKKGEIKDYAKWTCDILFQKYPDRFRKNLLIINDLKSRDTERKKDALQRLENCIENGENIQFALNLIGKCLKNESIAWYALNVVKKLIYNDLNISDIIPFLFTELKSKKQKRINDILTIISYLPERGYDISPVYNRLAKLLHEKNYEYRINTLYIFDKLLSKNVNLWFAEKDFIKAYLKQKDWYDEKIIYFLTDIFLHTQNYTELNKFLQHENRNIRSASITYIANFKQKNLVKIENLKSALIENTKNDYSYIKENTLKIITEYKLII